MARGSRAPARAEAEFRERFLELGNASAAARAVGIPESSGRDLARKAEADPEFVEARRELYARALIEAEALTRSVMLTAQARYLEPPPEPEERGAGQNVYVTIQDRRADHGRLVVEGYRALQAHRKILAEASAETADRPAIAITTVPRGYVEPVPGADETPTG